MAQARTNRGQDTDALEPLYARLPRGPHRLKRDEVAENQRQRMLGAMVEAVATVGYGRTSVKQIISLAGVSRRAFYEQFSNKQECFLATIDLVASRATARIADAYGSADGALEDRMRAALGRFAELADSNPKSAHLALIDAPSAGEQGWMRLTRMLVTFERMLSASFARTPGAHPLPAGVIRGIAGGLRMMTLARVREERTHELPELVEEMVGWTLAFNAPAAMRLQAHAHPAGASRVATRAPSDADGAGAVQAAAGIGAVETAGARESRARLLDSALELAALEGYGNVSPLHVVDRADMSIDTFFDLFGDMEECFLAALANVSEGVRQAISDPALASAEWPAAVRRALDLLMRHFAAHPSHAHMLATGSFEMGSAGADMTLELVGDVARALIAGAPGGAGGSLVREGIEGAVWHTVYRHAAGRRLEKLPAAADDLAYVVLAPFLGAEAAVQALAGERPPRRGSLRGERVQRATDRVAGSPATMRLSAGA